MDNPLDAMDEQIVVVNRVLAKAGLGHVPVEKLVLISGLTPLPGTTVSMWAVSTMGSPSPGSRAKTLKPLEL